MNQYSVWKYLIIIAALAIGVIYSLPNLYDPDPAVQVSGESSTLILGDTELSSVTKALAENNVAIINATVIDNKLMVRLNERDQQLMAKRIIQDTLGQENYVVALNLAPTTPDWLRSFGAGPLKLGLDLSGGCALLNGSRYGCCH